MGAEGCMCDPAPAAGVNICFDATIKGVHGGYSSVAERLTVAQDVVGSIPTSRPNPPAPQGEI